MLGWATLLASTADAAPDRWTEVRSPHFTVWSTADDGATRTLIWQMEQIRGAIAALWPWVRVDLHKPMLVLAVKDESSMKALVPGYWEGKGAVHPTSVWVSGPDHHYIAIRADVRGDDRDLLNPHQSAYFSYSSLVLDESFDRDAPVWFVRGLAGVLSNTIVRDKFVLLGPPIPWHLRVLHEQSRLPISRLVSVTQTSPEVTRGDLLNAFDAEAWAFVHMLLFQQDPAYRPRFTQYLNLITAGKDPAVAFSEALGSPSDFDTPFASYINRGLMAYAKASVDAAVKKEAFQARALTEAEASAGLAAFQVAMGRSTDARALIDRARQGDPALASSYVAEALLFDRERKQPEALAAYARAVALDTTSAYAYFRFAVLSWGDSAPDEKTLHAMAASLERAIALDARYASAYAYLGEVRAALKQPESETIPPVRRAIALEPRQPRHHLAAARVLLRLGKREDARAELRTAAALAGGDDAVAREAARLESLMR